MISNVRVDGEIINISESNIDHLADDIRDCAIDWHIISVGRAEIKRGRRYSIIKTTISDHSDWDGDISISKTAIMSEHVPCSPADAVRHLLRYRAGLDALQVYLDCGSGWRNTSYVALDPRD
jgi:hypothetical protein